MLRIESRVNDHVRPINRSRSMGACKRFLAGLTLLLAAVGLLLALVAGVGIWIIRAPAAARATQVFERIDAAVDVADKGLDHVEASLARAAERLNSTKE